MNPQRRLTFILTVFAGLCLAGCGTTRQPEDVPPLNKEADAAPVAETAAPKAETAAPVTTPAPAVAKPVSPAPVEATPAIIEVRPVVTPVAESPAPVIVVTGVRAPAVAKALGTELVAFEIPGRFGKDHARLVVQVNRTSNDTDIAVDRSATTRAIDAVFDKVKNIFTTDKLNENNATEVKAIHLALDTESAALNLVPSHGVKNSPDIIVYTTVSLDDKGVPVLTLKATDTRTGKAFWTKSSPL